MERITWQTRCNFHSLKKKIKLTKSAVPLMTTWCSRREPIPTDSDVKIIKLSTWNKHSLHHKNTVLVTSLFIWTTLTIIKNSTSLRMGWA